MRLVERRARDGALASGPDEAADAVETVDAADQAAIRRIMAQTDEPETETEGPPETSESGRRGSELAGEDG